MFESVPRVASKLLYLVNNRHTIARQELTTRDDYLATRFTKLSTSGHDLTPFTPQEVSLARQTGMPESMTGISRYMPIVDGYIRCVTDS